MKFSSSPQSSHFIASLVRALDLVTWACVIAFVVSPLVIDTRAYDDSFFLPKWAWIATWGLVGVAAQLGLAVLGKAPRFPINDLSAGAIVFLLLHAVSILWARSPSLAIERTLQIGSVTVAVWIAWQVVRSRRTLIYLGWLWISVALVIGIWTLAQDVIHAWWPERLRIISNLPDWRGYLAASLGNTNHIGDFMALALIPTLVYLGEARRTFARNFAIFAAVILAAALTVSYSVGSNAGLILGALMMLILTFRRERLRFFRRFPRWIALLALWGFMLAFYITNHPLNPHGPGILRQGFESGRWHEGAPTRLAIWAGALQSITEHPWRGVGSGNFTYVFPEMKSPLIEGRPDLLRYQGMWTNAAHQILLEAWSELGVLGLFVLAALIGVAFLSLLRGLADAPRAEFLMRMALAGMLTTAVAQGMMNFTLQHPAGLMSFYFILLAVAVEKASRRGGPIRTPIIFDYGWIRWVVEMKNIQRPGYIGASFHLPERTAALLGVAPLIIAVALMPRLHRPLDAQAQYRLARTSPDAMRQEAHLQNALLLDPNATGCRSYYTEWLIQQFRPAEALKQLRQVRKRLNSSELYEREARARIALGEREKAQAAYQVYLDRVWAVRKMQTEQP